MTRHGKKKKNLKSRVMTGINRRFIGGKKICSRILATILLNMYYTVFFHRSYQDASPGCVLASWPLGERSLCLRSL